MRLRLTWLTAPWGSAARRARMLAEAEERQAEERAAAIRRVVEAARECDGQTYRVGP